VTFELTVLPTELARLVCLLPFKLALCLCYSSATFPAKGFYFERLDEFIPRLFDLLGRGGTLPTIILLQSPLLALPKLPHNHRQERRTPPLNLRRRPRQKEPIESEEGTLPDLFADALVQVGVVETEFVEVDEEEAVFLFGVDFALVLVVLDLELD
jgi:hypothetical protein